MLKSYLSYIGLAAVLFSATLQSCKKSDGINNNQVIETPYSLIYGDSSGAVYNTNDGVNVKPLLRTPDGFAARAICASGNNILMAKIHLFVSTDNGANFNATYDTLNERGIIASCIYSSADQNRVYIASRMGRMGVFYSDTNGKQNTWVEDSYDVNITGTVSITSFTELQNNTMIGYDAINNRLFEKQNKADNWHEVTVNTALPTGGTFSLSHVANTIVAVDYTGNNGAYYTTLGGGGVSWSGYIGLPHTRLLSVAAPFDQTLLIGTASGGVYRLNSGGVFTPANNGLATATSVNGITAKENIYVDVTAPQQYVYLATNNGLYVSKDLGQNWALSQPGNIVAIY